MKIATFHETASRQHALILRSQALELGWSRQALGHQVDIGALIEETPLVLRLAGAPITREQKLMLAVLDAGPGATVSHYSAAAVWRSAGYRIEPVHVWRVRNRSNHPARVSVQHKTRQLAPHHRIEVRGIPVTNPTRTFIDLAALIPLGRAGRLLDDIWGRNLTNFVTLDRMLAELSRPGRTGLTLARTLVRERGADYRPPESNLERRALRILEDAGLTRFVRQVDIGDDEAWIGRVDLRHESLPLIVEIQSDLYHRGLTNERRDAARFAALNAAGFVVVPIDEFDIWHRAAAVISLVRTGFDTASEITRSRAQSALGATPRA